MNRGLIIIFILQFVLYSCAGEEKTQEEATRGAAKPAPPPIVEPEKPAEAPQETPIPSRNPFASYLAKKIIKEERVKTPLECCDVGVFKVIAVVSGIKESAALILASDGKRYTVKKGDRIGLREGSIVDINEKGVVVEEVELDVEGNVLSKNRVELNLPRKDDKAGARR